MQQYLHSNNSNNMKYPTFTFTNIHPYTGRVPHSNNMKTPNIPMYTYRYMYKVIIM